MVEWVEHPRPGVSWSVSQKRAGGSCGSLSDETGVGEYIAPQCRVLNVRFRSGLCPRGR